MVADGLHAARFNRDVRCLLALGRTASVARRPFQKHLTNTSFTPLVASNLSREDSMSIEVRRPRPSSAPWGRSNDKRRAMGRHAGPSRGQELERDITNAPVVSLPEPWRSVALTVVLPTYNEGANLSEIVTKLFALPLTGLRILVADDNSPDGTGDIAEELAAQYGKHRMSVVHRPGKEGLGRAYVDGITRAVRAGAQFVVQMDSDLSHKPEYLPQMLGVLLSSDADVVVGSRYVVGASVAHDWPWYRKFLSGFANIYVRALLRLGVRDVTAGFKLWRSSALEYIDVSSIRSNGYSFQVEMNYRSVQRGLKIVELPIHFAERSEGESKMSLRVQLESALMPFSLRYGRRYAAGLQGRYR